MAEFHDNTGAMAMTHYMAQLYVLVTPHKLGVCAHWINRICFIVPKGIEYK